MMGIIYAILVVAGLVGVSAAIWVLHPRLPVPANAPVYSPAVSLVLDMLADGRDWNIGRCRANHPTGASIWVANKPESSGLSFDGDAYPDNLEMGSNITTTKQERLALRKAVEALSDRRQAEQFAADTAAWAGRVEQYADNVVNIRGAA
jgi:hypothetical protein